MRAIRSSALLLAAAAAWSQQTAPEPASIEGTVLHSLTGAPLPRAHVTLRGSGPNAKAYGATTTAEGKYSINGIVPGTYQALATRVGFFAPMGTGGRTTIAVSLREGDKKRDVNLRLAPLGSISGRVVDAEGEPVESALVWTDSGQGQFSAIRDTTDDKGRFRLVGLQPGKYRVKGSFSNSPLPIPPETRTDGTVEVRYGPTYFGGATEYKSAARIDVGTGAEVNGIEIALARMPITRISGKVIGAPANQRGVSLIFAQTVGSRGGSTAKPDGTFEVWNMEPGKYFLTATWAAGNQRVQTAPIDIEVGTSNIEKLELRVIPPSDISGHVVFEDEQARPGAGAQKREGRQGSTPQRARVELRTVDAGLYNSAPIVSDLAEDGSFRLPNVPAARYRFMLSWQNAYVKSVTLGQERADGNVLYLRNGSGGASVTVVLSSTFGSVNGKVKDGDDPVEGARVALVRDDYVSTGDVTFMVTGADGAFTIQNVRPGKYRTAVVEESDNAPRIGNLDDYEDVLAHIDVPPKEKVTVDLKRHPPTK
jgi:protocatechuate 3,4-dioxygenase beta subunit